MANSIAGNMLDTTVEPWNETFWPPENDTSNQTLDYDLSHVARLSDMGTPTMGHVAQIGFTIYFAVIGAWGLFGNSLVIGQTWYYEKFHQVYMYVRACFAVLDILMICVILPVVLLHIHDYDVPQWSTCSSGSISAGLWFSSVHLTALLALERYCYFCLPMKYNRYFTLKSVLCVTLVTVTSTQVYMFVTEYMYGREIQMVVFMCQLNGRWHNLFQISVYFIPTILIVTFCIYKIRKLMNKLGATTQEMSLGQIEGTEQTLRGKAAGKALRLILLVSGAYWGTCMPYFIIRYVIFVQMEYTWEQLNSFQDPDVSLTIRIGHIFGMSSVAIDPLIYFCVNKNLRTAFLRLFCKGTSSFTWEDK